MDPGPHCGLPSGDTAAPGGRAGRRPEGDPLFGFAGHDPLDDIKPYGSKQAIVSRFADGHERVAQALLSAKPEAFRRPPALERWAKTYPTIEFMLPDLLVHHESLHIGQISIWRRAAGLQGVGSSPGKIREGLVERVRARM